MVVRKLFKTCTFEQYSVKVNFIAHSDAPNVNVISNVLTQQFAVAVIDGKIPQGTRHCSNYTVITMSQQLCHHGETLFQTYSGPDIPTIL